MRNYPQWRVADWLRTINMSGVCRGADWEFLIKGGWVTNHLSDFYHASAAGYEVIRCDTENRVAAGFDRK